MFHTYSAQLFRRLLLVFSIMFFFAACKSAGDPGPKGDPGTTGSTGATGPAGPAGATGATGNANVIQFSFGSKSYSNAFITYTLTGMISRVCLSAKCIGILVSHTWNI